MHFGIAGFLLSSSSLVTFGWREGALSPGRAEEPAGTARRETSPRKHTRERPPELTIDMMRCLRLVPRDPDYVLPGHARFRHPDEDSPGVREAPLRQPIECDRRAVVPEPRRVPGEFGLLLLSSLCGQCDRICGLGMFGVFMRHVVCGIGELEWLINSMQYTHPPKPPRLPARRITYTNNQTN